MEKFPNYKAIIPLTGIDRKIIIKELPETNPSIRVLSIEEAFAYQQVENLPFDINNLPEDITNYINNNKRN